MDKKSIKTLMGKRFSEFRNSINLSQAALASQLGESQPTITSIELGRTFPNGSILLKAFNEFGLNLNWLFSGEGQMLNEPDFPEDPLNETRIKIDRKELLPRLLNPGFLNKINNPKIFTVRQEDESMSPTILPGDVLLIEYAIPSLLSPDYHSLYLVANKKSNEESTFSIRRVCEHESGIILLSDNPSIPPQPVQIKGMHLLHIIVGKVVWIGRELKPV